MHGVSIREPDLERDVDALVAMTREADPFLVLSTASFLHRMRTAPPRAELAAWVAELDGQVVGHAYVFRRFLTEGSRTAICNVIVDSDHRRRGIGTALHERIVARAATLQAESVSVHLFESDATRDVPQLEPVDLMPYEEWEDRVLRHPLFEPDGSFLAYVGDAPAAVSLLIADRETGRAVNMFTGTLRAFRGRGLARAVKLASIEWAATNGITSIATTNDERNAPMLAVNRRLGYRPAGRHVEYTRPSEQPAEAP